jgi:integrase
MARTLNKLTDVKVKAERKASRHSDGGGLYLNVSPSGSKSWLFMWSAMVAGIDGKPRQRRREMGLGAYPTVGLADARKKAEDCRKAVEEGRDPIAERDKAAEPTFAECADQFLASMEKSWRNEKHRAQWRMTLTDYCKPIGTKRVSEISTEDVLSVLSPIWAEKSETASRLRGRIERVLDYAKAKGWRSGENPALWRGHLKSILPARQKLARGHHAAMPYAEVPAFVQRLPDKEAMAARALEFLILTAARAGEVLGATWAEIDFENKLWTVAAPRMKAGREHRVPLSERAVDILRDLHEARISDYVFPGFRPRMPLSNMALAKLMERMKVDQYTAHGFRSAFRDWTGDHTSVPREVAEAALAHTVGDATERAYRRADALEKRRKLMQAWADYLAKPAGSNVVPMRR